MTTKPLDEFTDEIIHAAEEFRVDANLIRAVCLHESAGNPWAMRVEQAPHLDKYLIAPRAMADRLFLSYFTEYTAQRSSWGLMQVMGFKARELGYMGHLTMLCDPEIGLFYGCKVLRQLLDKYGDESDVIAAYNAGSVRMTAGGMYVNQGYVDSVYKHLLVLRKLE